MWKIDIHSNHKSELSERVQGGEIIIGLFLDYILHRAETSAACKCVYLCYNPPYALPNTNENGEILSLKCIDGLVCDVCLLRRCQATSGDISTCVYNELGRVSSIRPSMRSLPAALDLEDEECAPSVCACVCMCVLAALVSGLSWDNSNQSERSCDVWRWRIVNWFVHLH